MVLHLLESLSRLIHTCCDTLNRGVVRWTRPSPSGLVLGTAADLTRSKPALIAENALLRQQLIILRRQISRPRLSTKDRFRLVLLASRVRGWKQALVLIQPETLLRWHRKGFRLFWKCKSAKPSTTPRISEESITLIRAMVAENRLWGAERVRGEVLKLGIRVSKRTIQKYMRQARPPRRTSQTWKAFLRNHAHEIWACDFLQVTDLCFRQLFAFLIVELASRTVVHVGVTRHPTDEWIAQQLRQATPFGQKPRYLIRDNDSKYGPLVARLAATSRIEVLTTPYHAPRANAICERFLGSVRRECLDHLLILHERHLGRVLREYVDYFNHVRPHQGIKQAIPAASEMMPAPCQSRRNIAATPILGGLHHDYRLAA
jgi:putative transposase